MRQVLAPPFGHQFEAHGRHCGFAPRVAPPRTNERGLFIFLSPTELAALLFDKSELPSYPSLLRAQELALRESGLLATYRVLPDRASCDPPTSFAMLLAARAFAAEVWLAKRGDASPRGHVALDLLLGLQLAYLAPELAWPLCPQATAYRGPEGEPLSPVIYPSARKGSVSVGRIGPHLAGGWVPYLRLVPLRDPG